MLLSGSEATGVSIVHKDERGVITVLECQSENYVGRRGVQKMLFSEWMADMVEAGFEVSWLPLNHRIRVYADWNE